MAGKGSQACETPNSPRLDFVTEMRNMIVGNGLPDQASSWQSQSTDGPATSDYLPPHMRFASPAEKSAYRVALNPEVKLLGNKPVAPLENLSQAEPRHLTYTNGHLRNQQLLDGPSDWNMHGSDNSSNNRSQSSSTMAMLAHNTAALPTRNRYDQKPLYPDQPLLIPRTAVHTSTATPSKLHHQARYGNQKEFSTAHTGYSRNGSYGGHFQGQAVQSQAGPSNSPHGTGYPPRRGPNHLNNQPGQSVQSTNRYIPRDNGNWRQQNANPAAHNSGNLPYKQTYQPSGDQSTRTRPPLPLNARLFDHKRHEQQERGLYVEQSPLSIHEQVDYLDKIALLEIPKAEISVQELQEKEDFRLELHNVCQWVIAENERKANPSFNPATVALKCFGSLSSGYATHGSDLDLAIVSPNSNPDAASPESEIPRLLEKALLNEGYGARLLTRTRVPIIKLCQKPTPQLLQALLEEREKWEKGVQAEQDKLATATNVASITPLTDSNFDGTNKEPLTNLEEAPPITPQSVAAKIPKSGEDGTTTIGSVIGVCNGIAMPHPSNVSLLSDADSKAVNGLQQTPLEEQQISTIQSPRVDRKLVTDSKAIDGQKDALTDNPQSSSPQPKIERTDEELSRLFTLAMKEGWFNEQERKVIYRFINVLKIAPHRRNPHELEEARAGLQVLPDVLSRYREPKPHDTHLDFPKNGIGIQCDINFSNRLALHNTLLLRCYSHCDVRIRPLVLFVKAWAKKRKINSPYHGTLSSYGYVLMMLHYLVNVAEPPLAPNLQLERKALDSTLPEETECDGCNVRFWRSEKEIIDAARRGQLTQNRQPIGFLLRGFFQYYAQEGRGVIGGGFSWSKCVISLRTKGGLLWKTDKGWIAARTEVIEPATENRRAVELKHRYLLAIEDPFELEHNVGRPVAHHGIVAIRDEFRRANTLVQNGGSLFGVPKDLFAEGQEHVQEPVFFGPNPERFNRHKKAGPQGEKKPDGSLDAEKGDKDGANKVKEEPKGEKKVDGGPEGHSGDKIVAKMGKKKPQDEEKADGDPEGGNGDNNLVKNGKKEPHDDKKPDGDLEGGNRDKNGTKKGKKKPQGEKKPDGGLEGENQVKNGVKKGNKGAQDKKKPDGGPQGENDEKNGANTGRIGPQGETRPGGGLEGKEEDMSGANEGKTQSHDFVIDDGVLPVEEPSGPKVEPAKKAKKPWRNPNGSSGGVRSLSDSVSDDGVGGFDPDGAGESPSSPVRLKEDMRG